MAGQNDNRVVSTVRMPPELAEQVRIMAHYSFCSMNAYMCSALQYAVEQDLKVQKQYMAVPGNGGSAA